MTNLIVLAIRTTPVPPEPTSSGDGEGGEGGYDCDENNPCTPQNAAAGKFYFPHDNPSKFVQCSQWGQCYVMSCGVGTEWDSNVNNCV